MEDKLNNKQKTWIKSNRNILKSILDVRKEEVKNLVMGEENDKRREILRELYWEYEHLWLPLLEQKKEEPKIDDFV